MASLQFISPFFIVHNLQTSLSFYIDKLGFKLVYSAPADAPFYAIAGRDNVLLMLKAITPGVKPLPNHTQHAWARWDAYISTDSPDELFEEFSKRNVTFKQPLQTDGDGLLGFEVQDADGYILFFGRPSNQ